LAFKLTPEEPFISSVVGEDGVYVVALDKRLPSELPALDTIRARVTEEYRMDQAGQMARNHGTNFFSLVTNGLAQAKSFAAICAEAKVASVALPKFAPAMRALPELDRRLDLGQIKAAAAGVAAGKCSEFMPTRDGGFVLFVKARTPVSEPELKQELPKFLASLRQSQQYEAFNEWFRKQLEQSQIQTLTGKDEAE
jgi:hypothetical protein